MDNRDTLGLSAANTVDRAELADAVGGDEAAWSEIGASVAVGGVAGVELVGVADEFHPGDLVDVVEDLKVEVAGDAPGGVSMVV